jgi:hypothetical protein
MSVIGYFLALSRFRVGSPKDMTTTVHKCCVIDKCGQTEIWNFRFTILAYQLPIYRNSCPPARVVSKECLIFLQAKYILIMTTVRDQCPKRLQVANGVTSWTASMSRTGQHCLRVCKRATHKMAAKWTKFLLRPFHAKLASAVVTQHTVVWFFPIWCENIFLCQDLP